MGDTLTYAWDLDGDSLLDDSTAAQPAFTYTTAGTYTVTLKVTDTKGAFSTATVGIAVQAPAPDPGPGPRTSPFVPIAKPGSLRTGNNAQRPDPGREREPIRRGGADSPSHHHDGLGQGRRLPPRCDLRAGNPPARRNGPEDERVPDVPPNLTGSPGTPGMSGGLGGRRRLGRLRCLAGRGRLHRRAGHDLQRDRWRPASVRAARSRFGLRHRGSPLGRLGDRVRGSADPHRAGCAARCARGADARLRVIRLPDQPARVPDGRLHLGIRLPVREWRAARVVAQGSLHEWFADSRHYRSTVRRVVASAPRHRGPRHEEASCGRDRPLRVSPSTGCSYGRR